MRSFRRHMSYSNVAASLALFVALGGGAYAATGGSFVAGNNGAIKGCVQKGGVLRVVKVGKRCPKGTAALTFSAKGRPGTIGPQGIQGQTGPAGSNATINGVAAGGDLTGTYPNPRLAPNVLTSANVIDRTLTLSDLGGPDSTDQTTSVSTPITLAAKQCINEDVGLFNPPVGPSGANVIGGMVIGTLTDATGRAAVDNAVAVAPSMLILTSQGGSIVSLILCNSSGSAETVPAGSVFHWRTIGP
jgi:hypothetical protein